MKLIAGVCVAWIASVAAGQSADFEAKREAARAACLRELEGYVEWCRASNLFLERKRALELVLAFDPANEPALRTLGYSRDKEGRWKPPAKPRTFRDFDGKALGEAPGKFAAVRDPFLGTMLAMLDDPALSAEQRELVVADVLSIDPDNQRVHTLLGEVHSDKGWVLPETVRAKARREELRAIVREGLEQAPRARETALSEREKKLQLPLKAYATGAVRVVGTVEEEEMLLMAQALHALEHLLRAGLGTNYGLPQGCTVFLLADPSQCRPFLEHHPAITPENRALYELMEGTGIQGTADFAFWTGDAQRRIDGIVRIVLGYLFSGAFEITPDQGWAYEGFGLVLTRSLVRSRMTWLAQPAQLPGREGDFKLRQRLIDPETNWVDEAYQLMLEGRQPPLLELLHKGANELTTEDVLYSYALATYLLEAQAECSPRILARLGTGFPAAQALQEALGMDPADFERHLRRWLSERT